MAKSAILNIEIVAAAKGAIDEFDRVKAKATGSNAAMKAAAVVASAAIIAGMVSATKAAADHEAEVGKLEQAYKNAGVSTKDMGSSLDEIEASTRRTGQSTDDVINAYARLVSATHNTAKAHSELSTAEDLAAFKGISVTDAATAITRASEGNTRALKEMGIATTDAAGKQLPAAELMKQLTAAVHGQADAFGNTAAGQVARFKETLNQTKEQIGAAFLPALKAIMNLLLPLAAVLARNNAILRVLAPAIAIAAGVIMTLSFATRAWAVIQSIVNSELWANPVGIVVLALVALVGIILVVASHWRQVSAALSDAWAMMRAAGAWILAHWPYIVGAMFGPLGILIAYLVRSTNAVHDVIGALQAIGRAVSDALGWLGKLPSKGGGLLSKISGGVLSVPGGGGAAPAPMVFQIYATPGDDLPEVVYQALRRYQRRHVRPELRPLFGGG